MMTKKEVLKRRLELSSRRLEIKQLCTKENRALSDEEVAELEAIRAELQLLQDRLDELEAQEREEQKDDEDDDEERGEDDEDEEDSDKRKKPTTRKQRRNYRGSARQEEAPATLTQVLRSLVTGERPEAVQALNARGLEENSRAKVSASETQPGIFIPLTHRSLLTAAGNTDALIEKDRRGILDPLTQNLVFSKVGANINYGLVGDVEFVKGTAVTSNWKGENEKATNGEPTFSTIEFKPKRLTTLVEVSMQLLMQDSLGVEQYLINQINLSIQNKLEATLLGKEALANAPKGLFNGTIADKGAASYGRVIDIINSLATKNALKGNPAFITSPTGFATLCKTPVAANRELGFVANYHDNQVLGYKAERTTAVPVDLNTNEQGLVFADWSEFFIGQWGSLFFTRDNVTRADEGIVRFIINSWWDSGFIRDESKAVASIKMA